jgi:hypothetical protein
VDVTGTTLAGSTFTSTISLTLGANVVSDTVQPTPTIEEGQNIVVSGCFTFEGSLNNVAVLFEVPDSGVDIRVFENTCVDVASDFRHVEASGTVDEGTAFVYTTEEPVVSYGVLATNGIVCSVNEHYDGDLNLCRPDNP